MGVQRDALRRDEHVFLARPIAVAEFARHQLRRKHQRIGTVGHAPAVGLQLVGFDQVGQLVHQAHDAEAVCLQQIAHLAGDDGVADGLAYAAGRHGRQQRLGARPPVLVASDDLRRPDPFVLRHQHATVQQQDAHVHLQLAAQTACHVQQVRLGAVQVGVVAHHQDLLACLQAVFRLARSASGPVGGVQRQPGSGAGAARAFQDFVAEVRVGLHHRAFGPFVPGVDEAQAVGLLARSAAQVVFDPVLEAVDRKAVEDMGRLLAPGGVVPCHHGRAVKCVGLARAGHRGLGERGIAQHRPGKARHQARQIAHFLQVGRRGVAVSQAMRRELHRRVKAQRPWVVEAERLHGAQVQFADAFVATPLAPACHCARRAGQLVGAVDQHHRAAVDADVVGVLEQRCQVADEFEVRCLAVVLRQQHFARGTVPAARPVFVGPADAEGEGAGAAVHQILQRAVQDAAALEPVVVIAEAVDAVAAGQFELRIGGVGQAQVVVAQAGGPARLQVAFKQGFCGCDVGPFGEAFTPPFVVFRNRMELRQVERHHARLVGAFMAH